MYENQNARSATKANANGTSSENKTEEEPKATANNKNVLHRFKSYLIALRVWSLSASIIPTILGEFLGKIVQQVRGNSPRARHGTFLEPEFRKGKLSKPSPDIRQSRKLVFLNFLF